MQNIDEIKNILDFYVKSNDLKNIIIDIEHDYSMADKLYGAMSLAIAIDSEFTETDNLGKVLRMLFLDAFNRVAPNYDFGNLKLGDQYKQELKEVRLQKTKDSYLVYKYNLLDTLLSNLIEEQGDKLNDEELANEAEKILSLFYRHENVRCREIFKYYKYNYFLRKKKRSGYTNSRWNVITNRVENVSEHVVATFALAMASNSEFDYSAFIEYILITIVAHEIGEAIIDDITPFDGVTPEVKKKLEHEAMNKVLGKMLKKNELLSSLYEFDERVTDRAVLVHYLDKIEADLQTKIFQERGMYLSPDTLREKLVYKNPLARRAIDNGGKTVFDVMYAMDKGIYTIDDRFLEFREMLDFVKENSILRLDNKTTNEKFDLDENYYKALLEQVNEMVNQLVEDENVECVFSRNYHSFGSENRVLEVGVVLKDGINYVHYDSIMKQINSHLAAINTTDVSVYFWHDFVGYYTGQFTSFNYEDRVNNVLESKILFDRNGIFSRLKENEKGRALKRASNY